MSMNRRQATAAVVASALVAATPSMAQTAAFPN